MGLKERNEELKDEIVRLHKLLNKILIENEYLRKKTREPNFTKEGKG